jgi:tetratricopeptide (TPR) repeat protein
MRALALTLVVAMSLPVLAGTLADQVKADPTPPRGFKPASPALQRALELYDSNQFAESLPQLQQVFADKQEERFNRQRARFFAGKALFNLGRHAEALRVFDEIVEAGSAHPYYERSLLWLNSLLPVVSARDDRDALVDHAARFPDDALLELEDGTLLVASVAEWCRKHGRADRAAKLEAARHKRK